MDEKWNFLLFEFIRLGGIADNVCQKQGEYGRGIFSVNSNLISKIYTPSKLMIKIDDIFLDGDYLRIKNDTNYIPDVKKFFNYYQDNFYWGGGGKDTVENFEKGLSLFSPNLKKLIKQYLLIDLEKRHLGDWKNVILREFLGARAFKFNNLSMICPILELVNHDVISLSFIKGRDGIGTPDYPPFYGELTHNYNNKSSIKRFFYQGFFSRETIVFSFPFVINLKQLGIKIYCKGEDLNDDSMKIERLDNIIVINGLPIGDVNRPNLPKYYFNELLSKIVDLNIPNDILSKIFELNFLMRKNLLDESQLACNDVSKILVEIIKYEMNLISSFD